jgi:hypothetical protein
MNGPHCHRTSCKSTKRSLVYLHRLNMNAFSKLTPCSNVILEKLSLPQLFKKFPASCTTQQFITMFTRACHFCEAMYPVHVILFLLRYIYPYPHPTPVFQMVPFLQVSPQKSCMHFSFLHHTCDMLPPLTV